ncbi:MAG: hypothetical protein JKY08_07925, partial [Flavobacteriaceae bacterium]|nr:hypothetical protein [Flavobacteriaceae bacterium]
MKHLKLALVVLLIASCTSKEMRISQVEDVYAKQNGGIPNENVFLIENFKDNKEGIKKVFSYANDTISKKSFFHLSKRGCFFIFNRGSVFFDDGSFEIDFQNKSIYVYINKENTNYFKSISISDLKNKPHTLKGGSDVFIAYKVFNLEVLNTFLNAIEKERRKVKYNYTSKQFEKNGVLFKQLNQEYQLINTTNFTVDCTLKYIDQDNFTIVFSE